MRAFLFHSHSLQFWYTCMQPSPTILNFSLFTHFYLLLFGFIGLVWFPFILVHILCYIAWPSSICTTPSYLLHFQELFSFLSCLYISLSPSIPSPFILFSLLGFVLSWLFLVCAGWTFSSHLWFILWFILRCHFALRALDSTT